MAVAVAEVEACAVATVGASVADVLRDVSLSSLKGATLILARDMDM